MLKRRNFIMATVGFGLSPYLQAKTTKPFEKKFIKVKALIASVQAHMFPNKSMLPSAVAMKSVDFLFETINHPSYDKDIRAFVVEGAEEFARLTHGKFLAMTHTEKEKALRDYEESSYGSSWLSRIMTLTMEGMFGNPIYGSNTNELGWKALGAFGGQPRPKKRYLDV